MVKESYHQPAENGAQSNRVLEAPHTSVATVLCIAVNKPQRLKSVAKPAYSPAAPAEAGACGCSFGMRDCERCCDVNSRPSQFGARNYYAGLICQSRFGFARGGPACTQRRTAGLFVLSRIRTVVTTCDTAEASDDALQLAGFLITSVLEPGQLCILFPRSLCL